MKDITIIFLYAITLFSGLIAWEFFRSKDGRLRILIIRLFVAKVWVYGGAALIYTFDWPIDTWVMRLVLNLPMFIVMLQLWEFIRMRDK